jgi:hypothetical protein
MVLNPEMISLIIKAKLDEIINGQCPEGFQIESHSANQIVLVPEDFGIFQGIQVNMLHISFSYKQVEFIIKHGL